MAARKPLIIGGGIVGAVLVVIVVAVIVLFSSIDSIIKAAVEKFGPEITQAKVTLDEVSLSTTSGEGRLAGLFVGNPKGFKTESAFKLGEIGIKVDVGTVTEDVIVIKDILIRGPEITYELGSSGSNLDALQRNVEQYTGGGKAAGGSGGGKPASGSGAAKEEGPKLVIENLRVQGGKINVSATFLGGKSMTAALPDLHLKDIGKEKKGATPGEVAQTLLAAIKDGVAKAVSPLGLDKMGGKITEGVGAATKSLGEGAKKAGDSIKKLFGK